MKFPEKTKEESKNASVFETRTGMLFQAAVIGVPPVLMLFPPRLPKAASAAKTVSMRKMTQRKAAKAVAASRTPQLPTPLLQAPLMVEPRNTARATKPANQNIIVMKRSAVVTKRWVMCGMRRETIR